MGLKIDIEEILKWENQLRNIENFVALQIIKKMNIHSYPLTYAKSQLVNLMKMFSVRVVFEACVYIPDFDLEKIKNKCENVVVKNTHLFKNSFQTFF